MASTLYRESISVPYFGQFLVYCRRHHPEEAQLRCVCLTDDTEQKTLECQEGFEILARGEPVEVSLSPAISPLLFCFVSYTLRPQEARDCLTLTGVIAG
ncbi:unnamed protein product [Dibothriocephalus latus]|uniref:Ankyrin UPA domain-containing protein n=1 Tax=Dibothriocephalus latus TaxID=60516 RepID=A0A3P6QF30_DIBLA|nr:unnamed protein product [Dibothriocephalus latus]